MTTSKELQKELDYFTTTIRKEMKRLGLENEDEIKKLKHELQDIEHIEKELITSIRNNINITLK